MIVAGADGQNFDLQLDEEVEAESDGESINGDQDQDEDAELIQSDDDESELQLRALASTSTARPVRRRHRRFRLRKKLSSFFSALWARGHHAGHLLQEDKRDMDDAQEMDEPMEVTEGDGPAALEPYYFKAFEVEEVQYDQSTRFPQPRSGHRIVADERYIYSYGGFNPNVPLTDPYMSNDPLWSRSKPLFQELWRFSKVTRTWTLIRPKGTPPAELASHSAVLLSRRYMLIYGGSAMPFGSHSSNKMYICDLQTAEWARVKYANVQLDPGPVNPDVPNPGYGQAITLDRVKKCLYIVGGTNGYDYNLEVYCFDWESKTWTKLSGTPYEEDIEPRYRHEVALWKEKLYVIGGGTATQTFDMERIPVFDIPTKSWSTVQTLPHFDAITGQGIYPAARYAHDCSQLGRTMYVVGGTNDSTVLADLWSLDLETFTWARLPCTLPRGHYFHSVAVTEEGQLTVFGGVTSVTTKERSNHIYQTWVKVPKLATIVKEAILSQLRDRLGGQKRLTAATLTSYFNERQITLESINLDWCRGGCQLKSRRTAASEGDNSTWGPGSLGPVQEPEVV